MIVTGVDRNLGQPGLERRLVRAMISVEREIDFGKAFLDDVFYLFALSEKATPDARHLTAMTFEQMLERRFITRAGSGDQRIICPLCK